MAEASPLAKRARVLVDESDVASMFRSVYLDLILPCGETHSLTGSVSVWKYPNERVWGHSKVGLSLSLFDFLISGNTKLKI